MKKKLKNKIHKQERKLVDTYFKEYIDVPFDHNDPTDHLLEHRVCSLCKNVAYEDSHDLLVEHLATEHQITVTVGQRNFKSKKTNGNNRDK